MQKTGQPSIPNKGRRIMVMANQPFEQGQDCARAAQLVAMLNRAGLMVMTASEPRDSCVQFPLEYHTRKRLAETRRSMLEAVTPDTELLIFASVLRTDTINKTSFMARLAERKRRFLLVFDLARKAKRTRLIVDSFNPFSGTFWITVGLIPALLIIGKARIGVRSNPAGLFGRITGEAAGVPDCTKVEDTIFSLAKLGRKPPDISLVADWEADLAEPADAREVARFCEAKGVKKAADFRYLADIHRAPVTETEPDKKRAQANAYDANDILSRYAKHYRTTLPERVASRIPHLQDDAAFMEWYLNAPFPNSSNRPTPIPRDSAEQMAAGLTGYTPATLAQILRIASRGDCLSALPQETLQAFKEPIGKRNGNLSRLELAVAILAKYPAKTREMAAKSINSDEIRQWFAGTICPVFPALRVFSTARSPSTPPKPALKISGIVKGQTGLARNAQMSATSLAGLGLDVSLHAANALTVAEIHHAKAPERDLKRSMILHNVNAHRVPDMVLARSLTLGQNPLHVGFLLWELEQVPESHRLAGELLDEIWVPSTFIQKTYTKAFGREVYNVGKAITLPEVQDSDLSGMGIKAHHRLFLVVLDANSSVERKNPLAAVLAFLSAFPDDQNMRILVKTTPLNPCNKGDPSGQLEEIRALSVKDPRIVIEQAHLPFAELLGRIKRADCVVSSHRSEGFGYIPAFALKMGRPVIATDYSGTQDFCTAQTAFPVEYTLIAPQFIPEFRDVPGALWADVDIHAMARQMQAVIADPAKANHKARAGQALVNRKYAPERLTKTYLARLIENGIVDR